MRPPPLTRQVQQRIEGALGNGELALDATAGNGHDTLFLARCVGPAVRTLAHLAAALVSVALGLALAGMPFNLGLMVASVAALVVGAEVERRLYPGGPR